MVFNKLPVTVTVVTTRLKKDALHSWTQGAGPINGNLVIPGNQFKLTACGTAFGPMHGCLAVSGDFNENKRAGSSRAKNIWQVAGHIPAYTCIGHLSTAGGVAIPAGPSRFLWKDTRERFF